jgi:hypothetical protein
MSTQDAERRALVLAEIVAVTEERERLLERLAEIGDELEALRADLDSEAA